jgi:hypothetical protein
MELSFIHNFLTNEGFILTKTKELNNNVFNYRKEEQDASIFRIGFIIKEEDGKNLSEYQIITELPLETTNGFMKADIVLVLKGGPKNSIKDAIIIENKLSQSTAFTARQKEGFGAILQNGQHTMSVKYSRPNLDPKVKNLTISKDNIYRIYDHGKDNINNVNIEKITKIR